MLKRGGLRRHWGRSAGIGAPDYWERQRKQGNARGLALAAKRKGHLTPEPCRCGSAKVEMHHPDYDKPLEVEWLCHSCHQALHAAERRAAKDPVHA